MKNEHTAKEAVKREYIRTFCLENAVFCLTMTTPVYIENFTKNNKSSFSLHVHRRKEILYIESGTATLHLPDREIRLSSGDIYVLPEMTFHWLELTSDKSKMLCFNFIIEKLEKLPYTDDLYSAFTSAFDRIGIYKTKLSAYMRELMAKIAGAETEIMLFPPFAEFMLRFLELTKQGISAAPEKGSSNLDEHVRDIYFSNGVDRFFNHCYPNDTSLAELAQALHMSVRQTERRINSLYGMPMRKRIIFMRLVNAEFALARTDIPTRVIAENIGFNNYNAFLDAFRQQYGCTPSEFRKKSRTDPAKDDAV